MKRRGYITSCVLFVTAPLFRYQCITPPVTHIRTPGSTPSPHSSCSKELNEGNIPLRLLFFATEPLFRHQLITSPATLIRTPGITPSSRPTCSKVSNNDAILLHARHLPPHHTPFLRLRSNTPVHLGNRSQPSLNVLQSI
jgi:hypothetical protein